MTAPFRRTARTARTPAAPLASARLAALKMLMASLIGAVLAAAAASLRLGPPAREPGPGGGADAGRMLARLRAAEARTRRLRTEAHEFENRLHLLSGLIELGEVDAARAYLPPRPAPTTALADGAIRPPVLAALIAARSGAAAGSGVRVEVAADSAVPAGWPVGDDELLIVGNLLGNAVEAAGSDGAVRLRLRADEAARALRIRVDDDGPGFGEHPDRLLRRGVTSKRDRARHGIGLASVDRAVRGRGGSLRFGVAALGGGRVDVELPVPQPGTVPQPGAAPRPRTSDRAPLREAR